MTTTSTSSTPRRTGFEAPECQHQDCHRGPHAGDGDAPEAALAGITGRPVIELDQHFWSEDLRPLSDHEWVVVQERLAGGDRWIMDGDLGPHDVPGPRLRRAGTVVILDLSLARCAWRAARRSREHADFWWWVITWRWRSRRQVLDAVAAHAPQAQVHLLRSPAQVRRSLAAVSTAAH